MLHGVAGGPAVERRPSGKRQPVIFQSKVFCRMDGGRGGKEGDFFAKKSPSFPPHHLRNTTKKRGLPERAAFFCRLGAGFIPVRYVPGIRR